MLHPKTEMKFVSPAIGYGIFAKELIPAGTITWARDQLDRIVSPSEYANFSGPIVPFFEKYTYRDKHGNYVFCWDLNRYMNHSGNPNCILTPLGFEIAIRDILPGEELTNDYATFCLEESFQCAYGKPGEREWVRPDDYKTLHAEWDKEIAQAMKAILSVPQPLENFLAAAEWRRIRAIVNDEEVMPSILDNF